MPRHSLRAEDHPGWPRRASARRHRTERRGAALFGAHPVAEALVATVGDELVGFALHYPTYSTIEGRAGIHLEDLYVVPGHRGTGLGMMFLASLARLATERGCARLEWWVLRTNDPALRFYRRLGARGLDEIEVMRLDGETLADVAIRAR